MCRLIVAALAIWAAAALADDKPKTQQQASPEAMQEMFMKLAQPGEQHEAFKSMVGEWDCTCRSFESGPDNPQVSKGKAKFTLLLGGRFLQQDMESTFNGMPFQGHGITGYDNAQQKYVGAWIDNFGTGILRTEGTLDPEKKTMTETAQMETPLGTIKMRMASEHKSDDEFLFTMYMAIPEGEQKTMEILYRRSK
jgi:hypothetical protein